MNSLVDQALSILVLDSGIGGVSVSQAISARRPDANIYCFADNEAYPYGLLEEQALQDRLIQVVSVMLEASKPDLIVVACNTASTSVLPLLRDRFHISVVGVVPGIKPAASQTKTKGFALLATPATISRSYIDELIAEHAADCEVLRIGSSELVDMAESKLAGEVLNLDELERIVREPIEALNAKENISIDTLVLGCTHFPFLQNELVKILPDIQLVDTREAIARRVDDLLPKASDTSGAGRFRLYFSKPMLRDSVFEDSIRDMGLDLVSVECKRIPSK